MLWVHLGDLFKKTPYLRPILRDSSQIGRVSYLRIGITVKTPQVSLTCSISEVLCKEEAINHEYDDDNLLMHDQS